ncbi:1477_t:CDS:2, partial [Cetraspora pellucida]
YITQESHKLEIQVRPPMAVTNAVSWRSEGIKYRKNEVFLDVIESVNLLVNANGNVLRSEILGIIKMKCYLSGMPELRLGLNDKVMFESTGRSPSRGKAIEMEDVKFHQCVRLSRFENDRTISFIPPDALVESYAGSRIEYMIKAKAQFKRRSTANNVEIYVPVPDDADTPKFRSSIGSVHYAPEKSCLVWKIKQFQGGKEFLMRAHFGLPSVKNVDDPDKKPPIGVKFEIPYFTTSGIQVRYLKIVEKSGYQALPWAFFLANVSLDPDIPEAEMSSKVSHVTPVTTNSYNLSQQPSHVDFLASTPSSITRVLTYTSPLVHLFSYFLSLLSWSTRSSSESCLLVAAWWTICLYPRELIIYGTHIGLISWISWSWVEKGKSERLAASQLDLNRTVQEIHNISDKLSSFHKVLNNANSYINWSDPVQTRKVLMGLAYSYPVWILFNYFVSLTWTFIIVGTFFLVWNSPWSKVIRYTLMRSQLFSRIVSFVFGFLWCGDFQQEGSKNVGTRSLPAVREQPKKLPLKNISLKEDAKTSVDLIYRFVLCENQRWWLGLDWTTNLFPNERPPWSDEYNEPVNDKDTFELPQHKEMITPEDPNTRKTIEWEWVDPSWWIDYGGAVDKEGWEYFDNRWNNPSSKSAFRRYTRRRKWARTARMIETIQKIEKPFNSTSEPDEKIDQIENTNDSSVNNKLSSNDHKDEESSISDQ